MAFTSSNWNLTVVLCIILISSVVAYRRFIRSKKLPAELKRWLGPVLLPIIGCAHLVPVNYVWKKFEQWSKEYGPIFKIDLLGTDFLVVSDERIAEELMVKRAKIYSDRPEMKSLFDSKSSTGTMEYLPLMGRNEFWSRQRKFAYSFYTDSSNHNYLGSMEYEVKRWLNNLIDEPESWSSFLVDMASKIMCQLAWDDPEHSEYLAKSVWGLLTKMSPGGPITNVLTPLWDYLPETINPWKYTERRRHDEQNAWWMLEYLTARQQNERGQLRQSWVKKFLDSEKPFVAYVFYNTGVAHEVEKDDYWNGYLIPKGTRILPLDFAILKDKKKYPKGEEFHPERWLEPGWPTFKEPLTKHPTVVGMSSFGWGRRTCLGQQITQDELLVACGGQRFQRPVVRYV
ncbi:hypothetical protein G6011_08074 [Alternaria panax]|uniref:Cytochrome P450 n=1 Tax=Alternaria panax TaxID=48097 RepID=A0AAD4I9J0_9PLEO|nr:hypothetical protein G6011_08074 [Alternaria panax]